MTKNNHESWAEDLAAALARATIREHWVLCNNGHYFAVPAPILSSDLQRECIITWLPRIGVKLCSRFDQTGRQLCPLEPTR